MSSEEHTFHEFFKKPSREEIDREVLKQLERMQKFSKRLKLICTDEDLYKEMDEINAGSLNFVAERGTKEMFLYLQTFCRNIAAAIESMQEARVAAISAYEMSESTMAKTKEIIVAKEQNDDE